MLYYPHSEVGTSKKLCTKFRCPVKIVEKLNDQNYKIINLTPLYRSQIVHFKRLRSISARYKHLSDYNPAFGNQLSELTEMHDKDNFSANNHPSNCNEENNVSPTISPIPEPPLNTILSNNSNNKYYRSGRLIKPIVRFNI